MRESTDHAIYLTRIGFGAWHEPCCIVARPLALMAASNSQDEAHMAAPFKSLSTSEFNSLNLEGKRAYLMEATAELERMDHHAGGWHAMFRQEQQPKPKPRPRISNP